MKKVFFDLNMLGRQLFLNIGISGISRFIIELSLNILNCKNKAKIDFHLTSSIFPQFAPFLENHYSTLGYSNKLLIEPHIAAKLYHALVTCKLPAYKGSLIGKLIAKYPAKLNPDIVHTPFIPIQKERYNSTPIVINTVHDIIALSNPEFFTKEDQQNFSTLLNKVSKTADIFCSVSNNTRHEFCEFFGISSDRVVTIPLAASPDLFYKVSDTSFISNIKKKYNIPNTDYILSVATLEPRKNISSLITAFMRIQDEIKTTDIKLVLVGKTGWLTDEMLENMERSPNLKEKIILTGYVEDKDLAALYSGALFFVYPSFKEGFGLPPLEAMQCGTPVISSNTSSIPEVVSDAGILINPATTDELCQAMLNYISSPSLRKSFSQRGIERAKTFSWKKCANETLMLYNGLLSF